MDIKLQLLTNHQFYTDDLKLYTKKDGDLEGLLNVVKRFCDDTGKVTFKKGSLIMPKNITVNINTEITIKLLNI